MIMKPGVDYIGITTPFYCNDGNGLFLLHKRSKNCRDEHGRWDPGSGQLNFGCTPEKNVLREAKPLFYSLCQIHQLNIVG